MEHSQNKMIKKCRICDISLTDGDFVNLFITSDNMVNTTYSGQLYEELMQLPSTADTTYPYICNGCDLQMKLFKRLKEKAWKRVATKADTDKTEIETTDGALCVKNTDVVVEDASLVETRNIIYEIEAEDNTSNNMDTYFTENEATESDNYLIMYDADSHSLQSVNVDDLIELDNGVEQKEDCNADDENSEAQIIAVTQNEAQTEGLAGAVEKNVKAAKRKYKTKLNFVESSETECKDCGLNFPSARALKNHRQAEHGRSHLCKVCQKLFKTAENLEGHMRNHLGLPAYECETCNKTFNQKVHYQYHIKTHTNKRDFACSFCDKSYFSKSDLTIHIKRTHEGEKNFVCNFKNCGKRFYYEQHLRYHSYVHGGQKTFECDLCQQKFKAPNALTLHKKTIHSNQNRFACSQCEKTFRRKHHLESHYAVHVNQNESARSSDNYVVNRKINILKKKSQTDLSSPTRRDDVSDHINENILENINDDPEDVFLMDAIESCSEIDNQNETNNYNFC